MSECFIYNVYLWSACTPGVGKVQKRVLDPLELQLQVLCEPRGCCESNTSSLEE